MKGTDTDVASRRLRAGIVGGGRGSFIGAIHRIAAELDSDALVVAGAMSSDPARARESAADWRLERAYDDYAAMATAEALRPDGIDFVIIATPNHLHVPVAKAFLAAGIAVICDKPLALDVAEGAELAAAVDASGQCFAVTYPYASYPMVREARSRVAAGELGDLRRVLVEYQQGWLRESLESLGNRQAAWRTDPAQAGLGGCVGDIGTHAVQLLEFVCGQRVASLCADLTSFVPGRRVDDDANLLLRLEGGAKGILTCSQIATGEENNLVLRVYGTEAALEWRQQEPDTLLLKAGDCSWQQLRTGGSYLGADAAQLTRTPGGHPEGYLAAFANVYRMFGADVRRRLAGEPLLGGYPSVRVGLRGVRFVSAAVESSRGGARWVDL